VLCSIIGLWPQQWDRSGWTLPELEHMDHSTGLDYREALAGGYAKLIANNQEATDRFVHYAAPCLDFLRHCRAGGIVRGLSDAGVGPGLLRARLPRILTTRLSRQISQSVARAERRHWRKLFLSCRQHSRDRPGWRSCFRASGPIGPKTEPRSTEPVDRSFIFWVGQQMGRQGTFPCLNQHGNLVKSLASYNRAEGPNFKRVRSTIPCVAFLQPREQEVTRAPIVQARSSCAETPPNPQSASWHR
jgi:hypothetical protein